MTKDNINLTWRSCAKSQIINVTKAINLLENKKVEELIRLLSNEEGGLFFTGVGKNSHVARKTSSTFSSLGIDSRFICPVEAVHGEMTNLKDNSKIVAISKSGKTSELVYFLRKVKETKKKVSIIMIHANENLSENCDYLDFDLFLNIENEGHNYGVVPITSITLFTVFLQSMGIHIAGLRGFTLENFLHNHPGGEIGKIKL